MTPLRGHLRRGIDRLRYGSSGPGQMSAGRNAPFHVPPISDGRSRPTNRLSRLGPASPAPGPPRDGQTVDCGESAPRSRRSWHRPPARRGSAVPTAGAPAGWSTVSAPDGATNQGPQSGTHSVDYAGISRPPRPGRLRPLRGGEFAVQSAVSVPRWLRPQILPPLHDIAGDSYPVCLVEQAWRAAVEVSLILRRATSEPRCTGTP